MHSTSVLFHYQSVCIAYKIQYYHTSVTSHIFTISACIWYVAAVCCRSFHRPTINHQPSTRGLYTRTAMYASSIILCITLWYFTSSPETIIIDNDKNCAIISICMIFQFTGLGLRRKLYTYMYMYNMDIPTTVCAMWVWTLWFASIWGVWVCGS